MMTHHTTALEAYTSRIYEELPEDIRNEITLCRQSLLWGPLYLDEDGEPAECFDENVRPHDFSAGCARIGEALANVSEVWVDTFSDDVMESEPQSFFEGDEWIQPDWEYIRHYEWSDVVAQIVGRELVEYVK